MVSRWFAGSLCRKRRVSQPLYSGHDSACPSKKIDIVILAFCCYTTDVRLETINAVAQLTAAVGVIASLFYLAVQIRQNTRSQRSAIVDSLTQSLINLLAPQASDPDSKMRGSSNAMEPLILSNGKPGIFTFGSTTIGRA
jgi:hypothetical protein